MKKYQGFFYPAGVIATIIILFCDMEIAFFSAAYEPALIHFLLYGRVFTIMGRCYALCKCYISKKE